MKVHVRMGDNHSSAIALVCVVLGFFLFWYFTVYSRPITNYPTPNPSGNTTIVVYGSSLSAGVGSVSRQGYVTVLEELLHTNIINLSRPGDRVGSAWSRIRQVVDNQPRIVIVELGYNDLDIPKTSQADVQGRLERIINTLHDSGAAVILLETPGYSHIYRNLSREYNTAIVPRILTGLLGDATYMFDDKYPNDAGHRQIAQDIAPVLKKLIQQ